MNLTVDDIKTWLHQFTQVIYTNKNYLSDLDTPIGDGDHGNNMARGMKAYEDALAAQQPTTISDTFKVLSMALISKVGGASGPLYGSAFMAMVKETKGLDSINSDEQLGQLISLGVAGIQKRGKATVGDKTMIDVWSPVATALLTGDLTTETIKHHEQATKDLVAKKGRASYVGERAVGHIDPGAASSAFLFETLVQTIAAH